MSTSKRAAIGAIVLSTWTAVVSLLSPSDSGVSLVKEFEGVRHVAYRDAVGIPTICYGSTLGVKLGMRKTDTECDELLREDLRTASDAVQALVKVPLTQNQFDALTSLVFNIGRSAFAKSTMLKLINQGKCYDAAKQFDRWVYAKKKKLPGLVKRREVERLYFEEGCHLWATSGLG